tara:strand:- start:736 stop:864 length:129 start_codon:yes stop_codon:yes gene_type:complete
MCPLASVVDYIDDKAALAHTELRQKKGDEQCPIFTSKNNADL